MTVEEGKEVIFENITNEEATDIVDEFTLDPSMVKDIIPFLIGGYPEDVRLSLSWTKEEMFLWAAYEDRKLNLEVDFVKFNDKALGNCFTFNHENSSTIYKSRRLGHRGGLQVMTKSISEEYVSWTVPSGIMVFVHDRHESVVSDSPRTNARGGFGTILSVKPSHYKRLGGRYGTCVRNTADVKSYYFLGSYTMDGCLRSCYQDSAQTMCGCMDPRYPMASTSINCPLAQRLCLTEMSLSRGDPSTWEDCVCPLPCMNTQYSITWTESSLQNLIDFKDRCRESRRHDCLSEEEASQLTYISISLPVETYHLFVEQPSLELMKYLSNLGGLLGVLLGMNLYSFIEVVGMIYRVFSICIGEPFCTLLAVQIATSPAVMGVPGCHLHSGEDVLRWWESDNSQRRPNSGKYRTGEVVLRYALVVATQYSALTSAGHLLHK
uniref:Amiloride-sensitive sodium channel n=1 Tax=Heterorhabditis bacteriophora TaxID=37862 RepID=A0A1I7X7R3_HETBA